MIQSSLTKGALALALASGAAAAWAADISVARFGAKSDGKTLNTAAIQKAIDLAAKRGDTVVFPAGTYLTGSIFVKSGVTLKLDKGVTLLGSQNIADYPVLPTRIAGIEMSWPAALVNIYKQDKAAIVGEGTIDGDGKVFWETFFAKRKEYEPKGLRWAADYDAPRPRLVQIFDAKDARLGGGLLLRRSGFWTVHVCYSDGVTIDKVVVRNNEDGKGPSTDGIDIDSSRNVLVQNAEISANDDALVLKAGRDADGLRVNRPTENVVFRDSVVHAGHAGITIGSETSGGFRNIEVYNIKVQGKVPIGIFFKSAHTRGGWAENVRIHDIDMVDVPTVFEVNTNWYPQYSYVKIPEGITGYPDYWKVMATQVPKEQGKIRIQDVKIWNIKASGAKRVFAVSGFADKPFERFTLSNWQVQAEGLGYVRDAKDWQLVNVRLALGDKAGAASLVLDNAMLGFNPSPEAAGK
jgi:polygalacturonase